MFEAGKEYRTRDGRRVRVYKLVGPNNDTPIGFIERYEASEIWGELSWSPDGMRFTNMEHGTDLMPPQPARMTMLANVYRESDGCLHAHLLADRHSADVCATTLFNPDCARIACVPVTFAEGDGLSVAKSALKPDHAALVADARRAVGPHTKVELTFPSVQNLSRLVWQLADALEGK